MYPLSDLNLSYYFKVKFYYRESELQTLQYFVGIFLKILLLRFQHKINLYHCHGNKYLLVNVEIS